MEFLFYLIIGIIQGLTEFLPISSSGHLVLFQNIVGMENIIENHFLNVMVHFGTMIAIIIVFRKKILSLFHNFISLPKDVKEMGFKEAINQPNIRFIIAIIIGTIPAFLVGFYLRDWLTSLENNLLVVAFMFLITSIILFTSKIFDSKDSNRIRDVDDNRIGIIQGLLIGIAQSIAILPGISRSGSTITVGRMVGLERDTAASFSFLLSLPAILGASILELYKSIEIGLHNINIFGIILGFVSSVLVGWISLVFLLKFIKKGKFYYFGFYVVIISIISFIIYFK